MSEPSVPCEGCVCVAICRLKPMFQLRADCALANNYTLHQLYFEDKKEEVFNERINQIRKTINHVGVCYELL